MAGVDAGAFMSVAGVIQDDSIGEFRVSAFDDTGKEIAHVMTTNKAYQLTIPQSTHAVEIQAIHTNQANQTLVLRRMADMGEAGVQRLHLNFRSTLTAHVSADLSSGRAGAFAQAKKIASFVSLAAKESDAKAIVESMTPVSMVAAGEGNEIVNPYADFKEEASDYLVKTEAAAAGAADASRTSSTHVLPPQSAVKLTASGGTVGLVVGDFSAHPELGYIAKNCAKTEGVLTNAGGVMIVGGALVSTGSEAKIIESFQVDRKIYGANEIVRLQLDDGSQAACAKEEVVVRNTSAEEIPYSVSNDIDETIAKEDVPITDVMFDGQYIRFGDTLVVSDSEADPNDKYDIQVGYTVGPNFSYDLFNTSNIVLMTPDVKDSFIFNGGDIKQVNYTMEFTDVAIPKEKGVTATLILDIIDSGSGEFFRLEGKEYAIIAENEESSTANATGRVAPLLMDGSSNLGIVEIQGQKSNIENIGPLVAGAWTSAYENGPHFSASLVIGGLIAAKTTDARPFEVGSGKFDLSVPLYLHYDGNPTTLLSYEGEEMHLTVTMTRPGADGTAVNIVDSKSLGTFSVSNFVNQWGMNGWNPAIPWIDLDPIRVQ